MGFIMGGGKAGAVGEKLEQRGRVEEGISQVWLRPSVRALYREKEFGLFPEDNGASEGS